MPPDAVNHPAHYTRGGIEVIDAIEAWGLGFNPGNAVKYLARAGHKDPGRTIEDLRKARWYVDREIARLEKEQAKLSEVMRVSDDMRIVDCHYVASPVEGGGTKP